MRVKVTSIEWPSTDFKSSSNSTFFLPCLQAVYLAISHHHLHRVFPVL